MAGVTPKHAQNKVDLKDLKKLMQFKPTLRTASGYFDVSEDTIERLIKRETDLTFAAFRDKYMSDVRISLVQKALKRALEENSNTMLIFCLKNICQWTDNQEVNVSTGEDGVVNIAYSVKK